MRDITVQDMRDYMIASAIFAQGQSEIYYKSLTLIKDMARRGCKPKLVDPDDVPDDALVCQVWQRSGGGYEHRSGELEDLLGPFNGAYEQKDWRRYAATLSTVIPKLSNVLGEDIYGYVPFCTSPSQGIIPMYISALEGKPFIDGDCCGTAMSPHLDVIAGVEDRPVQLFLSPYGETIIVRDAPPKRARFLLEEFHRISGCWFVGVANGLAAFGAYKRAIVKHYVSRLIEVGAGVRKAREEGGDPVEAFMKTAPAYRLFEGEVESFTLKKVGGRVQGDFYITGTGEFTGHTFRIWYCLENRISWLDAKPYVTIPDINGIVDAETCEGLSVFDYDHVRIADGTYNGKKVAVLGIAADNIWYELEGAIQAVDAQLAAYGFTVRHRPIQEVMSG